MYCKLSEKEEESLLIETTYIDQRNSKLPIGFWIHSNCSLYIPIISLRNDYIDSSTINSFEDTISLKIEDQKLLLNVSENININEDSLQKIKDWVKKYSSLLMKYWNSEIDIVEFLQETGIM